MNHAIAYHRPKQPLPHNRVKYQPVPVPIYSRTGSGFTTRWRLMLQGYQICEGTGRNRTEAQQHAAKAKLRWKQENHRSELSNNKP